jgi:hypothetical protein
MESVGKFGNTHGGQVGNFVEDSAEILIPFTTSRWVWATNPPR